MVRTIGAPHMCVTRWSRIAGKMSDGSTRRRQTCVRADGGHRPRVRPAAAMEHRQRPQVHAVRRQSEGERVAQRVEVSAAMVIDDALRVAGGARRVEQRDRIPLVARAGPGERRIAFGQQVLVAHGAELLAGGAFRIVDVDDERAAGRAARARPSSTGAYSASVMSDARAAVLEAERDRRGVEPHVERVEHGAERRAPRSALRAAPARWAPSRRRCRRGRRRARRARTPSRRQRASNSR